MKIKEILKFPELGAGDAKFGIAGREVIGAGIFFSPLNYGSVLKHLERSYNPVSSLIWGKD